MNTNMNTNLTPENEALANKVMNLQERVMTLMLKFKNSNSKQAERKLNKASKELEEARKACPSDAYQAVSDKWARLNGFKK